MHTFVSKSSTSAVLVLVSIIVIGQYQILVASEATNVPCNFHDTVNISDGHLLANGSYFHNNVVYPPHLIGTYDYIYTNGNEKLPKKSHLRGCICNIKNCTRLCCQRGSIMNLEKKECESFKIDDAVYVINVTVAKGSYQVQNIFDSFGIMYGKPCETGYFLEPHENENDKWEIFSNGNIEPIEFQKVFAKDQYCLAPRALDDNLTSWALNPYVCFEYDEPEDKIRYIQGVAILFSIPFMIATVIVYTVIPELRNLHGNCLRCYLVSMIISESMLAYMKYKPSQGGVLLCGILAYCSYFFILASFFWLNVISFDLWLNLCGTKGVRKSTNRKRFLLYSLYSWGMSLGFCVLATILQHIQSLPKDVKIGFGEGDHCFIASERWIQLLYLYGPISLIILANAAMFIMTALKIHRVQKEMSNVMSSEDSKKNLKQEKAQNGLFLKLFLIMGVTWSMETVSWLAGSRLKWFFIVTDICNALMGVIIFFLFVFKKKIKNLIVKRFRSLRERSDTSSSVRTTCSTTTSVT